MKTTISVLALSLGFVVNAYADPQPLHYQSIDTLTQNFVAQYGIIAVPATYQDTFNHSNTGSSFLDKLKFTIGGPLFSSGALANVKIDFDNNNVLDFNVSGLNVALYKIEGGNDVLWGVLPGSADVKTGSGWYSPGDYYFQVGGKADGVYGGTYTYHVVTSVPEADTTAMLIVGLGMVGFMARRRMPTSI